MVKSNFFISKQFEDAPVDNTVGPKTSYSGGALYIGRLSSEKGIETLISAWEKLKIPLRIAGDGPLLNRLNNHNNSNICLLGQLNSKQLSLEMENASFLVMPSEWFEGFPMVLIEAFAHSLPVVASKLGSMAEIVDDGNTGLHFEAGNPIDMAEKVLWMHNNPVECKNFGINARRIYEKNYSARKNYKMLINIYKAALQSKAF